MPACCDSCPNSNNNCCGGDESEELQSLRQLLAAARAQLASYGATKSDLKESLRIIEDLEIQNGRFVD